MRAEDYLCLARGSIDLVFVLAVEIDLVFNAGRKSLGFSICAEIDLVFGRLVEIDLISG